MGETYYRHRPSHHRLQLLQMKKLLRHLHAE